MGGTRRSQRSVDNDIYMHCSGQKRIQKARARKEYCPLVLSRAIVKSNHPGIYTVLQVVDIVKKQWTIEQKLFNGSEQPSVIFKLHKLE